MTVTAETGVTVIEESFLPEDPTAEEIVGKENVVDVGSVEDDGEETTQSSYTCSNCTFTCNMLSELEGHVNETGHGRTPEPVQPKLFSTPGQINKEIKVPLAVDLLNEKRERLAKLYQSALDVKEEKKDADSDFNARLKNIDEQMQEIARVLKRPFTYENAACEWRIIEEEHARGLYRLDTGELVEKEPLTAEDRAAELAKAEAANAETIVVEESELVAAPEE
jgi:hypothetical protein